mgnify:CR=1 FL=1
MMLKCPAVIPKPYRFTGLKKNVIRKSNWYEQYGTCEECRNKEEQKRAEEEGLPPLTGTERQVAWAVKIRNIIIDKVKFIDALIYSPEAIKEYDKLMDWLKSKTTADFWIDVSDLTLRELIKAFKKEENQKEIKG